MTFECAKIFVATLAYPYIEPECEECIDRLVLYSGAKRQADIVRGITLNSVSGARARQSAVARFMDTDCQSIMFIDRDHLFEENALERLFLADKDIISAITTKRRARLAQINEKPKTTVYDWVDGKIHQYSIEEYKKKEISEKFQPFKVAYAGSGISLVKRRVFEAMKKPYFRIPEGKNGDIVGVDVDFCLRAREFGFFTWVHPEVKALHIGRSYTGLFLWNFDRQTF